MMTPFFALTTLGTIGNGSTCRFMGDDDTVVLGGLSLVVAEVGVDSDDSTDEVAMSK